ncbi:Theileria-specific sub-telomeric protein, SVSP family, putative [Theileria annulata]|uniref:Theileria-specific sub-telomeric protein, SVSP family, putative n=1 Tax=Theileria annulata TaxID=5874 RepID=Q4UFT5_THEAN|nr:Theileria-specific sub-telomeric protein, SVSP family, putative [Theileria annulata]CAI74031.1 Theileria-specific sub-telomeric protein, SVSP family, putative [Theileria annulata]|eukprot:XP_951763.1 Theileria-specific sub-telomeric protein, SVSP family, putative [Theileria annulata]
MNKCVIYTYIIILILIGYSRCSDKPIDQYLDGQLDEDDNFDVTVKELENLLDEEDNYDLIEANIESIIEDDDISPGAVDIETGFQHPPHQTLPPYPGPTHPEPPPQGTGYYQPQQPPIQATPPGQRPPTLVQPVQHPQQQYPGYHPQPTLIQPQQQALHIPIAQPQIHLTAQPLPIRPGYLVEQQSQIPVSIPIRHPQIQPLPIIIPPPQLRIQPTPIHPPQLPIQQQIPIPQTIQVPPVITIEQYGPYRPQSTPVQPQPTQLIVPTPPFQPGYPHILQPPRPHYQQYVRIPIRNSGYEQHIVQPVSQPRFPFSVTRESFRPGYPGPRDFARYPIPPGQQPVRYVPPQQIIEDEQKSKDIKQKSVNPKPVIPELPSTYFYGLDASNNFFIMNKNHFKFIFDNGNKIKVKFLVEVIEIIFRGRCLWKQKPGEEKAISFIFNRKSNILYIYTKKELISFLISGRNWTQKKFDIPQNVTLFKMDETGKEVELSDEEYNIQITRSKLFRFSINIGVKCIKVMRSGLIVWENNSDNICLLNVTIIAYRRTLLFFKKCVHLYVLDGGKWNLKKVRNT